MTAQVACAFGVKRTKQRDMYKLNKNVHCLKKETLKATQSDSPVE